MGCADRVRIIFVFTVCFSKASFASDFHFATSSDESENTHAHQAGPAAILPVGPVTRTSHARSAPVRLPAKPGPSRAVLSSVVGGVPYDLPRGFESFFEKGRGAERIRESQPLPSGIDFRVTSDSGYRRQEIFRVRPPTAPDAAPVEMRRSPRIVVGGSSRYESVYDVLSGGPKEVRFEGSLYRPKGPGGPGYVGAQGDGSRFTYAHTPGGSGSIGAVIGGRLPAGGFGYKLNEEVLVDPNKKYTYHTGSNKKMYVATLTPEEARVLGITEVYDEKLGRKVPLKPGMAVGFASTDEKKVAEWVAKHKKTLDEKRPVIAGTSTDTSAAIEVVDAEGKAKPLGGDVKPAKPIRYASFNDSMGAIMSLYDSMSRAKKMKERITTPDETKFLAPAKPDDVSALGDIVKGHETELGKAMRELMFGGAGALKESDSKRLSELAKKSAETLTKLNKAYPDPDKAN